MPSSTAQFVRWLTVLVVAMPLLMAAGITPASWINGTIARLTDSDHEGCCGDACLCALSGRECKCIVPEEGSDEPIRRMSGCTTPVKMLVIVGLPGVPDLRSTAIHDVPPARPASLVSAGRLSQVARSVPTPPPRPAHA